MTKAKFLDPVARSGDSVRLMQVAKYIHRTVLALFLTVVFTAAPMAQVTANAHACCPDMATASAHDMHAQHGSQSGSPESHCDSMEQSDAQPCSTACCGGLASSVLLPGDFSGQAEPTPSAPTYRPMAQAARPAPQAIITPPPRALTFI